MVEQDYDSLNCISLVDVWEHMRHEVADLSIHTWIHLYFQNGIPFFGRWYICSVNLAGSDNVQVRLQDEKLSVDKSLQHHVEGWVREESCASQ